MGLTADPMAAMRTRHRTIGAIAVAVNRKRIGHPVVALEWVPAVALVQQVLFGAIHNPTTTPATMVLEMHAVGGQAGEVFRIDDRIVEVPRVPAAGVLPVATVRIPGDADRVLVVSTMPESGANYPVLLTLGRQT